MTAGRAMVWTEVEPLADVILLSYNSERTEAVAKIIAGQIEPCGLLPVQQPLNMEEVEAQFEDVARDMKCYVDANGNTYDFAFGLNWSGVINDDRVATYSQEPLTKLETEIIWPEK
jgi:beta-glucosidase